MTSSPTLFIKSSSLSEETFMVRITAFASVTAFLVVNNDDNIGLPPVAAWLLPSVLLVPLIVYWTRKYKKPVTKIR
jgi:hypothetical protein